MEFELIEKLVSMEDYEYYQYLFKTYNSISDSIKKKYAYVMTLKNVLIFANARCLFIMRALQSYIQ